MRVQIATSQTCKRCSPAELFTMRESRRLTLLHVLCATLSLARDTSWQSRCGQTCRKDSAKLLPSVVVPLPSRLSNATTSNLAPKPQLYVAMTTIPPRMTKRHLKQAVDTVLAQTRPPDKVLVSASRKYARFPGPIPDLSSILPSNHKLVETITCEVDMGPATKLLLKAALRIATATRAHQIVGRRR